MEALYINKNRTNKTTPEKCISLSQKNCVYSAKLCVALRVHVFYGPFTEECSLSCEDNKTREIPEGSSVSSVHPFVLCPFFSLWHYDQCKLRPCPDG